MTPEHIGELPAPDPIRRSPLARKRAQILLPSTTIDSLSETVTEHLDAGDPQSAAREIETSWRTLAAESGTRLRQLISGFDRGVWHDEPWIAAALGASHRSAGSRNGPAALAYFEAALSTAAHRDPIGLQTAEMRLYYAAALRSLGHLDEADAQLAASQHALEQTADAPLDWRLGITAATTLQLGMIALHRGDFVLAATRLDLAEGMSLLHLTRAETVECLGALAMARTTSGDYDEALGFAAAARDAAATTTLLSSGFGAPGLVAELMVAIERYRLEAAEALVDDVTEASAGTEWEPFSLVLVARLHSLRGRHVVGLDLLHRARGLYRGWRPATAGLALAELLRAGILVRMGQGDEAWKLLNALAPDPTHELCPNRFVAQLRLANGDLAGARAALDDCDELGEAHASRTLVDVQLLSGAIERELGHASRAALAVDRALRTMSRTGSRMPLLMVPAALLRGVLADARSRRQDEGVLGIIERYLEAVDSDGEGEARPEQLTDRETAVLDQLRVGATIAQAAAALFVSPNTVKTHLRSVYRKLGVRSRTEAVRKSQTMGLYQITPASPAGHADADQSTVL